MKKAKGIGPLEWEVCDTDKESGEPIRILSQITLDGYPMHFCALRVIETDDGFGYEPYPGCDDELNDVECLYGQPLYLFDIEGFAGKWIVYAHPHGR